MPTPRRLLLLAIFTLLAPTALPAADLLVYFGTRDQGPDKGFSVAHFNTATGALSQPEYIQAAVGPAFFMVHPDGRHLYTVNTHGSNVAEEGMVSAYELDPKTGKLTLLNSQPSGGTNPTYVSFDRTGRFAFVANYNGGNVIVLPIKPDGSLGERTAFDQHAGPSVTPDRTPQPYAHSIVADPSNRFVLCPDLGLDRIYIYKFDDKTGALTANDPAWYADKPASGPRHVTFSPDGKFVYVVHEIANTVGVYAWDGVKGVLTEVQSVPTLPADFTGKSTAAEIQVHPNGKFLYVTNRGHDSVAAFSADPASGRLASIQNISTQGKTPRNFTLDPTGGWLVASNQDSGTAIVFKVDQTTGKLTPTGSLANFPAAPFCERFVAPDTYRVFIGTHNIGPTRGFSTAYFNADTGALTTPYFLTAAEGPAYFALHSDGRHLYTCNTRGSGTEGRVSAYALDPKTGALKLINSQPSGGADPSYISFDQTGRFAFVANYNGGNLVVLPINPDGSLGERTAFDQHTGTSVTPDRRPQAYAHSIIVDPTNRFALCADLGLDRLYIYKFDAQTGALTPNAPAWFADKPGSGPRHVIFSPNGKFVYLIHEIADNITVFAWDSAKGTLTELQTVSTLPEGFTGKSTCAEIQIHPSGKFLYASNRYAVKNQQATLAVFSADPDTGKLALVQHVPTLGDTPRNFTLDPTGRWLLASNQDSNTLITYSVDQQTGKLTQAGPLVPINYPFCERFFPIP
ncbi:MAG TPA: lactonase family protein [Verrucomicrobiae bacterium]|nr:lactonase family protein [Verrucomicrobiae bacterium]